MRKLLLLLFCISECFFIQVNSWAQNWDALHPGVEEAEYFIKRAADSGDSRAQYLMSIPGYINCLNINEETRYQYLQKAANNGNKEAQCALGLEFESKKDYVRAIEWYLKSASQNCNEALFRLGSCYQYGKGLPRDKEMAAVMYVKSAFLGNEEAEDTLWSEVFYRNRCDWVIYSCRARHDLEDFLGGQYSWWSEEELEKQFKNCFNNLHKAALMGFPPAQYWVAFMYENGIGVKKNIKRAINWYSQSVENGYSRGYSHLSYLVHKDNELISHEYSLKSAEDGWYLGIKHLGIDEYWKYHYHPEMYKQTSPYWLAILAKGIKEPKDIEDKYTVLLYNYMGHPWSWHSDDAVECLEKIRYTRMNSIANTPVYVDYERIKYIIENLYNGISYTSKLEQDAQKGNVYAQQLLGYCYLQGTGVEKDPQKAYYWTSRAVEKGDLTALNQMGILYENGYGVPKDAIQAFSFYKKAAMKGQQEAFVNLAHCYLQGFGTPKDHIKSREWFEKAANNGLRVGQVNAGMLYIYNEHNYEKGLYWTQKAAEQGSPVAYFHLGECYENGWGVKIDTNKAIEYYEKSYSLGGGEDALNKANTLKNK